MDNKDNNEVVSTETNTDGIATETVNTGAENAETSVSEETVTFTEEELNLRIQSAEDKLRTKYSKKIKELEKQIEESKPVEKSEQEKDYESRLAALEKREKKIALNDALDAKGIDKSIAKFLASDVNVDDLASVLDSVVTNRNRQNSFVPSGHKSGDTMTKEEFKSLRMDQKERLFKESPELYRSLAH